ncbi:MAG: UDP-2,3-diacylglucosamine diphosphatase [Acidobacteriota bacterium]|nr:UDP-2,3-diacylglucosamine diphosphatase [Acidobacteriota bacterium]
MSFTLFVADVHLDRGRPHITELFIEFLANDAAGADALYILGDLYEYWLGDDDPLEGLSHSIDALSELTRSGVPAYFIRGNRDLLAGEGFARRSGCEILNDPEVIDLYGEPTLIMHGDLLCTDDVRHQEFRSQARLRTWQDKFLAKPLEERERLVKRMRAVSREETAAKPREILDVSQRAVEMAFVEHGVRRLIHGHTHRPGVHDLTIGGGPAQRIVLGDWYEQGSVLRCNRQTRELLTVRR